MRYIEASEWPRKIPFLDPGVGYIGVHLTKFHEAILFKILFNLWFSFIYFSLCWVFAAVWTFLSLQQAGGATL